MRNLRRSSKPSQPVQNKGNRDTLPGLLELLEGVDLLWVLTETVKRKPELHNWIKRVEPVDALNEPLRKPEAVASMSDLSNQTPLISADGEEEPLLGPMRDVSFSRDETLQSQIAGNLPIVQFSSALYFCTEDEAAMVVDVIRIGCDSGTSEVSYYTRDDTAEHGAKFEYTAGKLVFEPGAHSMEIRIPLLKTGLWDGVTQFFIDLRIDSEELAGASLGKYLKTTKVKIIDTSYFPSDKFADMIEDNTPEEFPMWSFLYEYMMLNVQDPKIRCGTIKALLVSTLHNLHFLFKLFLRVYLIDYLLGPDDEGEDTVAKREVMLLAVIAATVIPFATLHFFDYQKLSFGIGGGSRTKLQEELMKRFLDLREMARRDLDGGDLIVAMTHDVDDLVSNGYMTALKVAHSAGELSMVVIYQLLAPIIFGQERRWLMVAPILICPALLVTFMVLRREATSRVERERKERHMKLLGFIGFVAEQYRIITDYNRRANCVADCEADIKELNGADKKKAQVMLNNHYFSPWIALLLVCGYMYWGGKALIDGAPGTTLGMFLANVAIIETIGGSYGSIYAALLDMQSCFDSLRHITKVLNLPTDLLDRKNANRTRRERTAQLINELKERYPEESNHLDLEPIILEDLEFHYFTKKKAGQSPRGSPDGGESQVNLCGKVALHQGTMTIIKGPRSEGKTTLLRILGGVFLPHSGICFVPSHLRVLHVSAQTFFYRGTLLANVTYGMAEPQNAQEAAERRGRVQTIMKKLGVTKHVQGYFDGGEEHPWGRVLSQSECQILNLTRAFMFNPEVLCVDKPTAVFNDNQAAKTLKLLKEFVILKGLEQDVAGAAKRRPRTCVMTTDRTRGLEVADKLLVISAAGGIQEKGNHYDMEDEYQGALEKENSKQQL